MKTQLNTESLDSKIKVDSPGGSTEVHARRTRRAFTADYKRRILDEIDGCEHGQLGLLLRREGLYSSHVETWRRQRDAGELAGLTPRKRGRKAQERNPLQPEVDRLRRETARLQERLRQAEAILGLSTRPEES